MGTSSLIGGAGLRVNGRMLRYADSRVCPDCRTALVGTPQTCRACGLPLQAPLALELFETLRHADALLARLRAEVALREPAPAPVAATSPAAEGPAAEGPAGPARRTGLRTASVPAILLSLGALCLLVAAVTFLAIAWSWMGVGGRTGVLVGLTLVAAGTGVVLGRRGLRVAAESLTTVSLGLVALDVVGAITAGWLGSPDAAVSVAFVGAGVAGVSGATLSWSRLVAPQLGVVAGLTVALGGASVATGREALVAFVGVVALAAVAALGGRVGAHVLGVSAAVAAGTWWIWLLLTGMEIALTDLTWAGLWTSGHAFPLLGAAALLAVVAAVPVAAVSRAAGSGAASIVTLLVALPALDEGLITVGLALLVTLVVWSAIAVGVPRALAVGPLALAAGPAVAYVALLVADAADRVWGLSSPFASTALIRLDPASSGSSPLLLVPLVMALLAATWAMTRRPREGFVVVGLPVAAAIATLASYSVPLAVVVGLLASAAIALAWLGRAGLASGDWVVTVAAALPRAGLTALACAVAVTVAVVLLRSGRARSTLLGGLLLPAASAGLAWSSAAVVGLAADQRAVPILVVLGILAVARPRGEVEASAALSGLVAALASLAVAADPVTALAVDLTVAGVFVTLSSLVHGERRILAWPGGALLTAATWVRLADLGIDAPEAYTLPSAIVLVLVALHRLWRAPQTSTAVLLPGLTLATVPSLLWVLVDPMGARAVLLGVACLGLVLVGARLSWSAPLAVGSLVGALLVSREVAPYTGDMPQWVLIGLAGMVLIVVGVTWENRLRELRKAAAYLGRLR